ncbi:MAG: class I SAM-dependent DNA methyltransferase [Proteobacteria bacterium]|nr:class I SAM-dependent DNA methyltransferase [Pseudomonadota bacterium]
MTTTVFEHSLSAEERHAHGAHYTSAIDILKIIGPTIVEPWRGAIEGASSQRALMHLLARLSNFTVLDPACGSGNFLYVAYREIKRLESRILERLNELSDRDLSMQRPLRLVTARNFFGMDINPFAIELAKVTMSIARKLAVDELHSNENALPLDNLDQNFVVADALVTVEGARTSWPRVDVIIGNPPFLGAKRLKPKLGSDYVLRLRQLYPEVPGMADYCVYWLRRAHDHLEAPSAEDRFRGRAGLVGTQNIRNNESRVGGLDHIVQNGTILDAVEDQPWSGEAKVHVSIVNWVKTRDPQLLPASRHLWSKLETARSAPRKRTGAAKGYELAVREVAHINSALSDRADVSGAVALKCNTTPQRCFNGQMLGHEAFLLDQAQREHIVRRDPRSTEVIHPYLNGLDALTGSALNRFVLDFGSMDQLQATGYPGAFEWVRTHVLPDRERKATEGIGEDGRVRPHHKAFLARWWQLSFGRPEMLSVITSLPRYMACSYVTKRPIFVFVSSVIRPSNLIQVFGLADDYSFGVLQSSLHWQWFIVKCGKLKSDFRYSAESVFDTFPWPQGLTAAQALAIADAGREVRRVRARALGRGGLRALYRTLDLPGQNPLRDAHDKLDDVVRKAYGFPSSSDPLALLLELNAEVAARVTRGEPVNGPGVPNTVNDSSTLMSDDAIGA